MENTYNYEELKSLWDSLSVDMDIHKEKLTSSYRLIDNVTLKESYSGILAKLNGLADEEQLTKFQEERSLILKERLEIQEILEALKIRIQSLRSMIESCQDKPN